MIEVNIPNQYHPLILLIKEQKQGSKIARVRYLSACARFNKEEAPKDLEDFGQWYRAGLSAYIHDQA